MEYIKKVKLLWGNNPKNLLETSYFWAKGSKSKFNIVFRKNIDKKCKKMSKIERNF